MIINALLSLPFSALSFIVGLFPVVVIPASVSTSIYSAIASLYSLNAFIPVSTFATVITLLITAELFMFAFKIVRFLISHIPFIGGRGV